MSTKEASDKKDESGGNKNKKKQDELFIPDALERESRFRVACSVAAQLLFFHNKDFKGKTARGDAFQDSAKYRTAPQSDRWLAILLKQPTEKLSIALMTIVAHQEVRPSALGRIPLPA
jgi:hypothetical protein